MEAFANPVEQKTALWDEIYLARQPILDGSGRLVAYELLFRGGNSNRAEIVDGMQATGTVLQNLLTGFGIESVLGSLDGYLNVDREFLMSDLVEILEPKRIVLELMESVEPDVEVVERLSDLRGRGFRVAMDDFDGALFRMVELAPLMDCIKVDLATHPREKLPTTVNRLRGSGITLLAEKVETHDDYQMVRAQGFTLFQGYFFARPQLMKTKAAKSPEKIQLLRLLNLILTDADAGVIETELKRQPVLGIHLLRMANSAAMARTVEITSIRHALTMLGRRQLKNWLQIMIYAGRGDQDTARNPLLQLAVARAKLMELMTQSREGANADDGDAAFMTGMLSLVDVLLNIPVQEVVSELQLPTEVSEALLHGTGHLGTLLRIASEADDGNPATLASLLGQVPEIELEDLLSLQLEAYSWATAMTSGSAKSA